MALACAPGFSGMPLAACQEGRWQARSVTEAPFTQTVEAPLDSTYIGPKGPLLIAQEQGLFADRCWGPVAKLFRHRRAAAANGNGC